MKVNRITFLDNGSSALVELEPSAIARFFGAKYRCVELIRNDWRMNNSSGWDKSPWYSKRTDRPLQKIRHGWKIIHAMDAQPAQEIPKATVAKRKCTGCGDEVTSSFDWCRCMETPQ